MYICKGLYDDELKEASILIVSYDLLADRSMGDVTINNILLFYHTKQIDPM